MKRINNLFEKIISEDNLSIAIDDVNRSHRWLSHHRPNKTERWVEETKTERIQELRELISKGFVPSKVKQRQRWDRSAEKTRTISEPELYPDQYVHHAIIQVLEPIFRRGMDDFCCASVRGRGIHYGVKAVKKWMKNDIKGTKYCVELDIHHFYDSLQPQVVMNRLSQLIKDGRVLRLCDSITKDGILIGLYTSQWFANAVLTPLDHLIRSYGVKHYIRYLDNITIFDSNRRKLQQVCKAIEEWLTGNQLRLKKKPNVYCTADRLPYALGYRYGRGYTLLRKRNLLRLKRQISELKRKRKAGKQITHRFAAGLISRLGQLRHCSNYWFYRKYYPPKLQKYLKEVIRKWNTSLATEALAK